MRVVHNSLLLELELRALVGAFLENNELPPDHRPPHGQFPLRNPTKHLMDPNLPWGEYARMLLSLLDVPVECDSALSLSDKKS